MMRTVLFGAAVGLAFAIGYISGQSNAAPNDPIIQTLAARLILV